MLLYHLNLLKHRNHSKGKSFCSKKDVKNVCFQKIITKKHLVKNTSAVFVKDNESMA